MTSQSEIRRHPDGSIDTRHYMELGLDARARAATGRQSWLRAAYLNSVSAAFKCAYRTAPNRPSISAPSAS